MRLEKFKEKDHKKKITIGISIVLILLVAGIIVYRSFAFYEEKKAFDVIKGQVPDQNYDLMFSYYIKDENGNNIYQENMPEGKDYSVSVTCSDGATGEWDKESWGPVITNLTSTRTKCKIYFERIYMSDYIIALSETSDIVNQVTHEKTAQTENNATIDYRYSGSSDEVNNYVCFGSEEAICPNDNLYRIIGVFPTQSISGGNYENRVKLIKNAYYTESESGYLLSSSKAPGGYGYQWNSSKVNKWELSTLQKSVLNTVYWNSLGVYQKYIDTTLWYLGAPYYNLMQTYTSAQFYQAERSTTASYSKGSISYQAYIGLMYPSDYGYSINSTYWDTAIYTNREKYAAGEGWLYATGGKDECLISPESSNSNGFDWHIGYAGGVSYTYVYRSDCIFGVRPTFYLSSKVMYKSGTGTSSDPYRIHI